MIGSKLAHFQITAKLGEGGMGEVYEADDAKLGRKVAIKLLPEAVSSDPERLARFEREAKLLAALNHTNIASIYAFESAADEHFLVMELAPGEDLRERLGRGPIPLDEALPIALQIARALEAAHERGIIHRDLKPANIKVDDEGEVKVLDFGLAKALDVSGGESTSGGDLQQSPLSLSPTLTAQMTGAGVLLGTAAYMSPEQARGKTADKRADIWAFGAVLWETLTGKRLFEGETVSDTLAAILRADPDWESLPADTPASVHRVLRRCLERNPKDRLHDIADARIEIEEALLAVASGAPASERPVAQSAKGSSRFGAGVALGLVLGALLAALVLPRLRSAAPVPGTTLRLATSAPAGAPIHADDKPILAISPDGQTLVVVGGAEGSRQLYQRQLRRFDWQPIPGTDKAYLPFFSPDGEWVGFLADGKLKKVSLSGGTPQDLCDAPNSFGAAWGPSGTIVFNPTSPAGLFEVSELGGAPEEILAVDSARGESEYNWPQFLPDGRSLLFTIWRGDSVEGSQVALLDLDTGEKKILLDGGYGRITDSGHLLYTLANGVYAAPFDLERRELIGKGIPLPESIYRYSAYWLPALAVSTSGTLAYVPGRSEPEAQLVAVTPAGIEEPLVEAKGAYQYPRLSPDGTKLVVNILEPEGASISILDLTTGLRTRLPRDGNNLYPLWTGDGSGIIYQADRGGTSAILRRPADGTGSPEELVTSSPPRWVGWPMDLSPDGRHLLFYRWEEASDGNTASAALTSLDLDDPTEQNQLVVVNATAASLNSGAFSPDGAWVAYSLEDEIFVQRFSEAGARFQVSQDGGLKPRWSADGSEVYFRTRDDRFMAARIDRERGAAAGAPRLLFKDIYDDGIYIPMPNFDVHPDASRLLMIKPDPDLGKSAEIHLVLDWLSELNQLVPPTAR